MKRRASDRVVFCDPGCARPLRTDQHHIRLLHWIILTFDPAALPHGVQLPDKATFICFSSLALPQLSAQQELPVVHVFFSIL